MTFKQANSAFGTISEWLVGDSSGVIILKVRGVHGKVLRPGAVIRATDTCVEIVQGQMRMVFGAYNILTDVTEEVKIHPINEHVNLSMLVVEQPILLAH